jgi:hypothetical protein
MPFRAPLFGKLGSVWVSVGATPLDKLLGEARAAATPSSNKVRTMDVAAQLEELA